MQIETLVCFPSSSAQFGIGSCFKFKTFNGFQCNFANEHKSLVTKDNSQVGGLKKKKPALKKKERTVACVA